LLGDIIHFVLLAAILFLFLVKFLGWLMRPKKTDEAVPVLNRQEELLTEIRDLLKTTRQPSASGPTPTDGYLVASATAITR
jgi:large conductance mechanosensitive channel